MLDYINLRLSGTYTATADSILTSWVTDNRDPDHVKYDPSLVRFSGIDPDKFPDVVPCTAVLGALTSEAAEALLDLAVGVTPQVAQAIAGESDPFLHPDAQRRFRMMNNVEELARALDYPGKSGRFSSIRHSANWSNATTAGRQGFPVRRERAKPSWHCTGP